MSTRFVHILVAVFMNTVVSQNDACVSNNDHNELNGVYQYFAYNETINSPVYYCQDCGWNNAPSFLYGFRNKWTDDLYEDFWIIGPDPRYQAAWSYCEVGVKPSDYAFNVTDCYGWATYINSGWVSDDIVTEECDNPTQSTISYVPHAYPSIVFGFKTPSSTQTYGTSIATITMTLYWNYTKYQCGVLPFQSDTVYLCDTSETETSLCDDPSNAISYGLQIDNNDNDAVEIDEIIIKHIYNQSVETDMIFDYFCANTSQQNPHWPTIPGRCSDALYGGYDIFAVDKDDTNSPFNLFLLDESVLFYDAKEVRTGLESYVVPQQTASSCAESTEDDRYELIARLKNSRLGTFSPDVKTDGNENVDDVDANTYSIIGQIGDIIRGSPELYQDKEGKYQFKLIYDNADGTPYVIDFKQSSWIQDPTIEGYEAVNVPTQSNVGSDCDLFRGLALSSSDETYIDGSDGSACWWISIGSISLHTNSDGFTGIPGFNSKIAYSFALYILKPLSNHSETTTTSLPLTTSRDSVAHDIIIAYQQRHDTTATLHEKQQYEPQHTPTAPESTILTHIQVVDGWDIFNIEEASTLHIIAGICIVFVCCSIPLLIGICIGCCCYYRSKKKSDEPQSSTPKDKDNGNVGEIEIKIDPMQPAKEVQMKRPNAVIINQPVEGYEGGVHKMSLFSQESELSDGMYENVKQKPTPQNIAIVRPENTNHINPRTKYIQ